MDYVQDKTGIAVENQAFHVVSKEMQLPDMSTWTTEERATKHDEIKGAVPTSLLDSHERFNTKTGETWDPKDVKPGDVAKYCDGHPNMWSEKQLEEEVKKAGEWGGIDPIPELLGDGGNACDITVGNNDSYAKVGYAGSEFFTHAKPPVPEATVKAFAAVVQIRVDETNAVVFPAFGHLIRWLKANTEIPLLDEAAEKKQMRMVRARQGKSGGY